MGEGGRKPGRETDGRRNGRKVSSETGAVGTCGEGTGPTAQEEVRDEEWGVRGLLSSTLVCTARKKEKSEKKKKEKQKKQKKKEKRGTDRAEPEE
ncbi:hypothetical protein GCM10018965_017110 [Nonomuraea roseola]